MVSGRTPFPLRFSSWTQWWLVVQMYLSFFGSYLHLKVCWSCYPPIILISMGLCKVLRCRGPKVDISTGEWVDMPTSYWPLLKMPEYSWIISSIFCVSGVKWDFLSAVLVSSSAPGHYREWSCHNLLCLQWFHVPSLSVSLDGFAGFLLKWSSAFN